MTFNATIYRTFDYEKVSDWLVSGAVVAVAVATGVWFRRNSAPKDLSPPIVRSWIPWLGSSWDIERNPDTFFEVAEEKYGGIFGVKTAGSVYYYVTKPELIQQIYKQPKVFSIAVPQKLWGKNCFSSNRTADPEVFRVWQEGIAPHMHRALSPKNVMSLVEAFDRQLQITMVETPLPKEPISLEAWVMRVAYQATGKSLFGPTLDVDSLWEDWKGFDEGVWKVALGYPPVLCPNFVRCREQVINRFSAYAESPHEPCEYVAERERIARDGMYDAREIGVIFTNLLWPLMANVPWGSLWTMIVQLQRNEGFELILAELDEAGEAFMAGHPDLQGDYTAHLPAFFASSPSIALFSSTIGEILRLMTDTYSMRGVLAKEVMLGGYTFKENDTIVCRCRSVHLSETEYDNAKEFVPTRFVKNEAYRKLEGSHAWMPYGGGISMCSGRFYAAYHVKILLTSLIKKYRFHVLPAQLEPVTLANTNRGFGLRRPKGNLMVRIERL